ncbi:Uncharacterised protein [uncultured archaeon]|nr:Uncharacterised protein [uncultured archaeon]
MKNILVACALVFLLAFAATAFADNATPENLTWSGMAVLKLDKTTFAAGEAITGKVILTNNEEALLLNGKIVLHIAQGTYEYPSQFNANDNIVLEKIIDSGWILPRTSKEINFSLPAPAGGDYRIDLYSWAGKSKLLGASNILMGPSSESFKVAGDAKKRVSIAREFTSFNLVAGPVGFPIKSEAELSGFVMLYNPMDTDKQGLKLGVKVCEWASIFCDSPEQFFEVPVVKKGDYTSFWAKMNAPKIPSAYEILMTLYDGEKIESVYKNRVIVSGGTAKIRKFLLKGLDTKSYSVDVTLSGSPDHFTNPDFNNFSLTAEVFNNGASILRSEENISGIAAGEIMSKSLSLGTNLFDKMCLKIIKDGTEYESQCVDVPILQIQNEYDSAHPKMIDVSWNYDNLTGALTITLKKEKINAQINLYSSDSALLGERAEGIGVYSRAIVVPKENLTLAVDDFDAKQQKLIEINLAPEKIISSPLGNGTSNNLGGVTAGSDPLSCNGNGIICSIESQCSGAVKDTIEGKCCIGQCLSSNAGEANWSDLLSPVPLAVWILIIVAIILVIVVVNVKGAKRK